MDVPEECTSMSAHSHECGRPCITAHEMHAATLFKDRKYPLERKTLVERAGNLNQPMGMDSSGQVKLFQY